MKRIHGKTIPRLLACLLICCLLCACAWADTYPVPKAYPAPEEEGLCGGPEGDNWLQVNVPYGTARITFMQSGLEQLRMTTTWGTRKSTMHLGNYTIYSLPAGGYYTQPEPLPDGDFSGLSATVTLGPGTYLLQVKAGEATDIREKGVYGYWTGESWVTQAPSWYVSNYSGCTITPLNGNAAYPSYPSYPSYPTWGNATVWVLHYSADGTLLFSEQQTLQEGYNTLYARYDLIDYTPSGENSHVVTVSRGVPSEDTVVFYYKQQSAQVTIRYRALDGMLLDTEVRQVSDGNGRVACTRSFTGYTLADQSVKTVSVSGGQVSPAEVTFYFQRNAPAVSSAATISVIYQAEDGSWSFQGSDKRYTPGTYTIYPDFNTRSTGDGTYVITGPQYYTVTVSAAGTASLSSVTFRYKKQATATAPSGRMVTATAKVFVRSGPGIDYEDITDMKRGDTALYLEESKKANGVTWYKIKFFKNNREYIGWVSSKYSELD